MIGRTHDELPVAYIALRDYLIDNFNAKRASHGKECIIRCPYCGDSRDKHNAHLYIGVNSKNGAISFNCFKCNARGAVGTDLFRRLNIYDTRLIELVLDYNRSLGMDTSISRGIYLSSNSYIEPKSIIPIYDTEEYRRKLNYINKRIGGHLTFGDIQCYGIVLNLLHFLQANGVTIYSRHPSIMEQLSFGFVGFLSVDSSHVALRRIIPEEKVHESLRKRYTNYTINEKGYSFYCIKEGINYLYPNMICIAEGGFDALGIHYNLLSLTMNKLVISSNGKEGLEGVLKYLIWKKKMSFMNTTFHIYIDNDISPYDMSAYRSRLSSLGIPYVFHRNSYTGEKDYGVPGDRIIDTLL